MLQRDPDQEHKIKDFAQRSASTSRWEISSRWSFRGPRSFSRMEPATDGLRFTELAWATDLMSRHKEISDTGPVRVANSFALAWIQNLIIRTGPDEVVLAELLSVSNADLRTSFASSWPRDFTSYQRQSLPFRIAWNPSITRRYHRWFLPQHGSSEEARTAVAESLVGGRAGTGITRCYHTCPAEVDDERGRRAFRKFLICITADYVVSWKPSLQHEAERLKIAGSPREPAWTRKARVAGSRSHRRPEGFSAGTHLTGGSSFPAARSTFQVQQRYGLQRHYTWTDWTLRSFAKPRL